VVPSHNKQNAANHLGASVQEEPLVSNEMTAYQIGYGDILKFQVLYHPEYALEIKIPSDETISLPRIPRYETKDKTLSQIQKEICDALSQHLKDPEVTINLIEFTPLKIVVLGEVLKPGLFTYDPGMNAVMALAMAGGLKESANRDQIVVVPKNGKPYCFSESQMLRGEQNGYLHPGDLLLVAAKPIHRVNVFIEQFFAKTNPVLQYYLNVLDITSYDDVFRTR
jgi:polysaccharide export outer membrane protein